MRVFWLGRIEDKDHLFFEHPFSIKVKSHSKKKKEKKKFESQTVVSTWFSDDRFIAGTM